MAVDCYMCGTPFERRRRGPVSHHCQSCRAKNKRKRQREVYREAMSRASEFRAALPDDAGVPSIDELAAQISDLVRCSHITDRQPEGYKSPRGSEDGRSTYFRDLAGELDHRCRMAANHEWWYENPHWSIGL